MNIKRAFHHIHLLSKNPEDTTQWYLNNLGGRIEAESIVRGSVLYRVRVGEAQLNIRGQWEGETVVARGEDKLVGIDHFALAVEGLDVFMDHLKEKGVKIVEPIFTTSTGERACFIEAPDGVLIEIIEI